MWNTTRCIVHSWPDLFGFHMNISKADLTDELAVARVYPTSPENTWAGDPGVPKTLHVNFAEDGSYESIPNPDWTEESPDYETVFLLFVDEAEAKELASHLWQDVTPHQP